MPEHSTFFAYQAHIAGTDYIAIPRQIGTEARVEIYPLHNPGIDDVTGAIIAGVRAPGDGDHLFRLMTTSH